MHGKFAVVPGQTVRSDGGLPHHARHDRGGHRSGDSVRASFPEATQPLPHDDLEDPPSVPDRVQVAGPENARGLVAWHLIDLQAGLGRPDVHQRLDLEARAAADFYSTQMTSPEGVVAVTQVGEMSSEHPVDQDAQQPVSVAAHAGDVIAAATAREARALRVVGAGHERADEPDDLCPVGGSVRVDHHEDVAGRGRETRVQRISLAAAGLGDHLGLGAQRAGDGHGVVDGMPVHQDDFVYPRRQCPEDMRKVSGLVPGRDDDTDGRRYRQSCGNGPVRRRPADSGRNFPVRLRGGLTHPPRVRQIRKYHLNRNLTRGAAPRRYVRI